jgi:hypothetical protein
MFKLKWWKEFLHELKDELLFAVLILLVGITGTGIRSIIKSEGTNILLLLIVIILLILFSIVAIIFIRKDKALCQKTKSIVENPVSWSVRCLN